MKHGKILFPLMGLILIFFTASPAVSIDFDWDDESMFMDEGIEEIQESSEAASFTWFEDDLGIGGNLVSSISSYWAWSEFPDGWNSFKSESIHGLNFNLSSDIYLDARPHSDLRIFAKARSSYPFTEAIQIRELFSDVHYDNSIFFRVGKQNIQWGSGYFWSPADILSLVPIDPDKPEAEREGPLSVKATIPIREHSIDLYFIGNDAMQGISDTGIAGRAVLYLAPVELTLGSAYQREKPLRIISALNIPIGDVLGFSEGRISFGREHKRYVPAEDGLSFSLEPDDNLYFSGTAGFRWTPQKRNFALIAQYLYQAEGYSEDGMLSSYLNSMAAATAATADASESSAEHMDLLQQAPAILRLFGRHHSMLSVSHSKIFTEKLYGSLQWQAAWSDLSGLVSVNLGWQWFQGFSIGGGLHYSYGDAGTEFGGYYQAGGSTFRNPFGKTAASLELRIGGGRF
ncbi:hypothetical protein [Spirochaeta dissipatitropha]